MKFLNSLIDSYGKLSINSCYHIRTSKSNIKNPFQSSSLSSTNMMNTTQIGSIDQLKLVFEKFDVNGDGKISNSELGSLMSSLGHSVKKEELQRMMEEMDSDGDGFVDLNEFIELHTNGMDSAKVLDDVKNAFLIFDMNGDGSISPQDLQKVLRNLGQSCSIAECRRMINGFDSDGDGMMNFEDFKVMMMGPPQQT